MAYLIFLFKSYIDHSIELSSNSYIISKELYQRSCVAISAVSKGLLTFFKLLFLQNRNTSVKNKYGNSAFNLCRTFLINKHYCVIKDASDVSGFKIPTKMVLELDA